MALVSKKKTNVLVGEENGVGKMCYDVSFGLFGWKQTIGFLEM